MRDPERIDKFCSELAECWKKVPDWRFGQLIVNVYASQKRDPFFMEEEESMDMFKKYFGVVINGAKESEKN